MTRDRSAPLHHVRALLLDLDGTLVDALAGWRRAFAGVRPMLLERYPSLAALGDPVEVHDQVLRPAMHEAWEADGAGEWSDDYVRAGYRTLLARHAERDDALADAAAERYLATVNDLSQLYEDAARFLEALDGRIPLAVVSNGIGPHQRAKLRACGILERFEAVVISEEVGLRKPDPAIFRLALDSLGVPAAEAAYAGDNPAHDIEGARAAGIAGVWVCREDCLFEAERPVDYQVESLEGLLPLLGLEASEEHRE